MRRSGVVVERLILPLVGIVGSIVGCGELLGIDGSDPPLPIADSGSDAGTILEAASPALDAGKDREIDAALDGRAKLVFLSRDEVTPITLGGHGAFDALCQLVATDAGLPGVYAAWISSSTSNAIDRVGTGPWALVDGRRVAAQPTDLATGYMPQPIVLTERGGTVSSGTVWTGTRANGTASAHCADWTSATATGSYGKVGADNALWTEQSEAPCDLPRHVYCFER